MIERSDLGIPNLDVSRETVERFEIFENLVRKWNPRINLVSRKSLDDLWSRHILDSIQIFHCSDPVQNWVDLGSGGGFPGLVAAILAADLRSETVVTLIESDNRKCAFLRTVIRETQIPCKVLNYRIEQVTPQDADIVSARALADLSGLLSYCDRHLAPSGVALFPKGVTWKKEVDQARKSWRFDVEAINSVTEEGAVVLKVTGASRV